MKTRTSLLELHREFLPALENHLSDDIVSFSVSVMPLRFSIDGKDRVNLHWDCHFNIRSDNTRITLHAPQNDQGLVKLETKLLLLRDTLAFFIAEQKRRMKEPGLETLSQRIWLNEEGPGHFTGYCFYKLEPRGSGLFYIADCHRVLNFHLDVYQKGQQWGDKRNTFTHKQHRVFGAFIKNINLCLKKIQSCRDQVKAGILGDDVGKDGWGF